MASLEVASLSRPPSLAPFDVVGWVDFMFPGCALLATL